MTSRPNTSRSIPASVRRRVYERDNGRCTFVSAGGRRCRSRTFLQYHHKDCWARHRLHDPERITLRCHAHNQLAAELDFGRDFMRQRSNSSREEFVS